MIIYKITNKKNGKIYIGQTIVSLQTRWVRHQGNAKRKETTPLYRAMNKYGLENFTLEIIDKADGMDSLNKKEIEYIAQYNSVSPNGYNLEKGGTNKKHHPLTIEKMKRNHWSKKPGYKNPNKNKQMIQKNNKTWKTFCVFDVLTGERVGIWNSQSQCARDLNINQGNIGSCLRKQRIDTCGYYFEYVKGVTN